MERRKRKWRSPWKVVEREGWWEEENQKVEKIKFQVQMAFVMAQDPGHFYKRCFT